MYLTQTDIANLGLVIGKGLIDSARLKDLIDTDKASAEKAAMSQGVNYYAVQHDILNRSITYYNGTDHVEDPVRANVKIVDPFHQLLVNQKIDYVAGKPIALTAEKGKESVLNKIKPYIGKKFNVKLNTLLKGASNKGVEWLHVYINSAGKLELVVIPAEQIVPVYDTRYEDTLTMVIRYYEVEQINEKRETETITYVEIWDKDTVTYYTQDKGGNFVLDSDEATNPHSHWSTVNTLTGATGGKSWGKVPFIPVYNNDDGSTDLEPIKALIDAYDLALSDFANNLQDIVNLIYVLRGYDEVGSSKSANGTSISGLKAFVHNLINNRAILVDGEGGVDTIKNDIPDTARQTFLQMCKENIYAFGRGIDTTTDKFGGAPSGVALNFLYAPLDLKANALIQQAQIALEELFTFIAQWEGLQYAEDDVTVTFNQSLIMNVAEAITNCTNSKGVISDETIIANHPWVTDPKEEAERVKAQNAVNLDNIDVNDENTDDKNSL